MRNLSRRNFLRAAAGSILTGPAFFSACKTRKKTLNILNWAGYIANPSLTRFEQETGIAVNYGVYFKEENMLEKLTAEAGGFDLVIAPDYLIPQLKASRLIGPVPHDRLPQMSNIARRFRDSVFDPGLSYSVPYLWGTTGLGFNTTKFEKKPDSWWALWDERYKGRLTMLDDAREAVQCALLLSGLPTDSGRPEHLQKARELLIRQRTLLKGYSSSTYPEDLAAGAIWLAQSWNGDVLQASYAKKPVDYIIPKEGSFIWIDNFCFVGKPSDEAARFVDFALRPEIAAEISNAVRYATANDKALPLLDPAFRTDPRAFPPPEVEARLRPSPILDQTAGELWKRTWDEIKGA